MNCEEFRNILMEHLASSSPGYEKAWKEHRLSCESCQKEAQDFEALQGMIRNLPPKESLPAVFWDLQAKAILKKIDPSPPQRVLRFWEGLFQPRSALALAALILFMVLGIRFWQPGRPLPPQEISPLAEQMFNEEIPDEEISGTDDPIDELDADQIDSYYAVLAEKYLPSGEEWDEDADPLTDLSPEELDRLVDHFEKESSRRIL